MTTEDQTQPTDPASQAQRDREMLARIGAGLVTNRGPFVDGLLGFGDLARLHAIATRALELEEELRIFEEQHDELQGDYDDLEAELELMNGVVAGMEADAELGRLLEKQRDRSESRGRRWFSLTWRCNGRWWVDQVPKGTESHDTPEAALRAALEVDEP